ncbi:MAG: ImmA/IrrE family metallo-endopeptidase [Parvibaculum sp.]|nr:ImmA/IrrE family metallo-endopeptidase [Parvibaculum sp.]
MGLELDRIALDDFSAHPEGLARAIHAQLPGHQTGAVPVYEIARALDIEEIREERLSKIEGALITTPEKSFGSILVNANSSFKRRRFTVGHELCHFLDLTHQATASTGFQCAKVSFVIPEYMVRHMRQENEADRFAIELLAPEARVAAFLKSTPDLEQIIALSEGLWISKTAAARRYVELHPEPLAVVLSQHGVISSIVRPPKFPYLRVWNNHALPATPARSGNEISDWHEVRATSWLSSPSRSLVRTQTLYQRDGYAMTLMHADLQPSPLIVS